MPLDGVRGQNLDSLVIVSHCVKFLYASFFSNADISVVSCQKAFWTWVPWRDFFDSVDTDPRAFSFICRTWDIGSMYPQN